MSEQLQAALRDLAEDAPRVDNTVAASERTWRRARQARRRGVVAVSLAVFAVLIGGVFVAVGLSGIGWPAPAKPGPYDVSKLAIPDKIWTPSPWTSGTDEAGPLGPLALIATAPRQTSWFHTDGYALFGVSAATGAYRFIDLPGADIGFAGDTEVALSPSGTKIGYWILGDIATARSQPNDVGFAVYDTVTGHVTRHLVPSRYGLSPDWLVWSADSSRLVANFGKWAKGGSRNGGARGPSWPAVSWDPVTGDVISLGSLSSLYGPFSDGAGIHGFTSEKSGVTVNPLTGRRLSWRVAGPAGTGAMSLTVSPDRERAAFEGYVPGTTGRSGGWSIFVAASTMGVRSIWESRSLDNHAPQTEVLGWVDATHLLVRVWTSSRSSFLARQRIAVLDVDTADLQTVIQVEGSQGTLATFANGLIDRPFVSRAQPPSIRDPRTPAKIIAWTAGFALLLGVVVLFYRRDQRFKIEAIEARGC